MYTLGSLTLERTLACLEQYRREMNFLNCEEARGRGGGGSSSSGQTLQSLVLFSVFWSSKGSAGAWGLPGGGGRRAAPQVMASSPPPQWTSSWTPTWDFPQQMGPVAEEPQKHAVP